MPFHLTQTLKALLFSTSEPLSVKDIQAVIARWHEEVAPEEATPPPDSPETTPAEPVDEEGQALLGPILDEVPSLLTGTQIREALDQLARELQEADDVYEVREGPKGWQIVIRPRFADWVRLLRGEPRPRRLSRPQLETLAVVAYRQPVTRAEIEAIRGVSADNALAKLQELGLVHVAGLAELPGRPRQFGTTPNFLDFCGLKSLDELPASDVLSPEQISAWVKRHVASYETGEGAPDDPAASHQEQAPTSPNDPPSDADLGLPSGR